MSVFKLEKMNMQLLKVILKIVKEILNIHIVINILLLQKK